MNFKNTFSLSAVMLLTMAIAMFTALPVRAQVGFDAFALKTLPVVSSASITGNTTNNPVDTRGFEGIAKVDVLAVTNASTVAGAVTFLPMVSADLTNWTALSSYAISTPHSIIYTNVYYPQSIKATNVYNLDGTLTNSPVASTVGYATPYVNPAPFTNTGAITLTPGTSVTIGYSIQDAPRYFRAVFTSAPTNTSTAGFLTARKQQFP